MSMSNVTLKIDAMLRPWRYCTFNSWLTLGEHKRGIDHPCSVTTRGRPITTLGLMATMLRALFEGLTYAPIQDLITIVGEL
jgi:hypothetical protein